MTREAVVLTDPVGGTTLLGSARACGPRRSRCYAA